MRILSSTRTVWAALLVFVVMGTTLVTAAPAQAGPSDPPYLSVTKVVSNATPAPGEPFTYTIRVTCSEASCVNAVLNDALPADLAGYAIEDVALTPSTSTIPRNVTWTVDGVPGGTAPAAVTADTTLQVDFTGAMTAPAGTGLQNGQTFTVLMTLRVPATLPPGTTVITNTATTSADNSSDSAGAATITVTQPEVIAVGVTKAWTPATQAFQVGRASAIALSATNTSNIPIDSLVVQEPQTANEGAAALNASNPFTLTDFTGFTGFALPTGATTVQVDAYVFQAGAWGWVAGTPQANPALPTGVATTDVGGLRLTYAGGPAIAPGAFTTVTLDVAQRATDRTGTDLSTATHSVTNVVKATAAAAGHTPATATASAVHTVNPAKVSAATSKSITPNRIAAGSSARGSIVATNASDVGVVELRAADLGYFTDKITFGGFTASPTWPSGTESAAVIYHHLVGGTTETVSFANGVTPVVPSQAISGFEVVYTSAAGNIAAGSSGNISFDILTTEAAIVSPAVQLSTTNSVTTTVTAANGLTASAIGTANLVLLKPAITIDLTKVILPSGTVAPGERVVTSLNSKLTTTSDYITANKIVVEDSWTGAGGFWDAFDLVSVAPTQVPANTSLLIEVLSPDTLTWVQVKSVPADTLPSLVEMTQSELEVALLGATFPNGASDATGIRFTFQNLTVSGFASDTIIKPYVTSRARDTLRVSGTQTAPVPNVASAYGNAAVADGSGKTPIGTLLNATDPDTKPASIKRNSAIGPDGIGIGKKWNIVTVPAQSGAQRLTTLSWSVNQAYQQVAITDPENPADPQNSAFEAFDLKSINSIAASNTPFTNGWYLKYDTIDSIELYDAVNGWVTVTAPVGGWVNAGGSFVGYTLTAPQSAATTGVRIILKENSAARTAALTTGSDPYAPAAGTGVAWSSQARDFVLTWQLRNVMRGSTNWVTDTANYNTATAGIVDNTVQIDATPAVEGPTATHRANATIQLQGFPPGVTVSKAVSPTSDMYVPMAGTPAASYPSATFTVTGKNNSVVRAGYVRVMDSPACTDADPILTCEGPATAVGAVADPFTPGVQWLTAAGMGNPFDRFDLRDVTIAASIPAEVDLTTSVVWLLHYDIITDTYSTTSHFASGVGGVNSMTASDLSDVVGISVTFQGSNPATAGGSISASNNLTVTLVTRLRTDLRVSGVAQTVAANVKVSVPNRAFAQSYDVVLNDGIKTGALSAATPRLTGGDINVAAVKTISPAALTEPTRNGTVTVTLGANQGTAPVSSLAPAEVRLTDDIVTSPAFWNQFNFTGVGSLTAPAGADQVVVSVYGPFGTAGAMAWVSSSATPTAAPIVPVTAGEYPDIQGVRLAFSRADGAFFSSTFPAANWTTSSTFTVKLRDTYRDSGAPVVLAGTVANTVTAISDRLNGESSVERTSAAQISLSPGSYAIKVNKLANEGNRTASAGESVPWDLTFTNSGTGFLTITELRDTLPTYLVYLGDTAPVYTPDPSGMLPAPANLTQVGNQLVFTWPSGSRTMSPGETFSVRLKLEVQPGLAAGQRATNEMAVTTAETLSSCSNIVGGGSTTAAFATDPTTCGTTDYVTPSVGPNLFTVKGVRGSLPGAENPANPGQECQASLTATGGSYFRAPCAANSVIGGVDEWVLRAQNAGTTGLQEMVLFDALPSASDRFLISGTSRGSAYRPQMLDDLAIAAPAGTNIGIEVTFSADPCYGTWAGLEGQNPCEQNSEAWSAAGPGINWSAVTAFRVTLDFLPTAAGMLAPGDFVDATFSSKNMPATTADPSGASVDVPVTDSYAWNQFGVKYLDSGASAYRKIAPAREGVHLMTGALQLDKVITGTYAGLAPSSFVVDVACTVEGAPLNMGQFSRLLLSRADGFTRTIRGLPTGSECTMTESSSGGASTADFSGIGVARVSSVSASVPVTSATAMITLTNHFDRPLAFSGVTGVRELVLWAVALLMLGSFLTLRGRRRLS